MTDALTLGRRVRLVLPMVRIRCNAIVAQNSAHSVDDGDKGSNVATSQGAVQQHAQQVNMLDSL